MCRSRYTDQQIALAPEAQRLEAARAQQRRGQRPEHRPHRCPLRHEFTQAPVRVAPAQEDERGDREPTRLAGGAGGAGARLRPAPHGPCAHEADETPRERWGDAE